MKLIIFILSVFTVVFVSANEQIPLSSFVTATATLSSPVITSGKSVDVPISIHNAASEDIVVFGISGRFTKTPQFKDTYATLPVQKAALRVPPASDGTLVYKLFTELEAVESVGLQIIIQFSDTKLKRTFEVTAHNGKVTIMNSSGTWFDPQLWILYAIGVGIAYLVISRFLPKKNKKTTKTVKEKSNPASPAQYSRPSSPAEAAESEWLPKHHLSAKSSKRTTPNRRDARLRREYLYRKTVEESEKAKRKKAAIIKSSLASGKKLPTEIQAHRSENIVEDLPYLTGLTDANAMNSQDDEYRNAGMEDPKIMITTSRDPSSRLSQFSKELRLIFPNSARINRGNYVIKDIVSTCKTNGVTDLILVHETRGVPDGLIISHLPFGPTAFFSLHSVALRHDLPNQGTVSEAFPHLIFSGFNTKLGQRVKNILSYLFPVPKEDSKRILTFANNQDYISFRHHVYHKSGHNQVDLAEIGPRFELKLYEIKLGTVDISTADSEWVLRSYMNTARKRDYL